MPVILIKFHPVTIEPGTGGACFEATFVDRPKAGVMARRANRYVHTHHLRREAGGTQEQHSAARTHCTKMARHARPPFTGAIATSARNPMTLKWRSAARRAVGGRSMAEKLSNLGGDGWCGLIVWDRIRPLPLSSSLTRVHLHAHGDFGILEQMALPLRGNELSQLSFLDRRFNNNSCWRNYLSYS